MKIAVNTRLLLKGRLEGIGWFSYETLKRITQQHPEHQFFFFFDRPYNPDFIFSENITPFVLQPPARHPFLFYLWFEFSVRWKLIQLKPDVFLSPDGYLSLHSLIKSVSVIHDLNFEHYPNDIPLAPRLYYKFFFPHFARKATRIATVSEYSKNDIVEKYGINPALIDVVFNGANEQFCPISDEKKLSVRNKYSNGCPFFLFVGALHPRKNIVNLFLGFDAFKKAVKSEMVLVIVGQKKWWTKEIRLAYESMEHKNAVVFTGRLDDGDLKNVMASSFALTYISYFEGFGIPILEAMHCDVPVITSNCTSMPEVSGGAAMLVNPFSIPSISGAMLSMYSNTSIRQDLIEKGRIRRKDFSWQKTADALWACIEKANIQK